MKISKTKLRQIIKEELSSMKREQMLNEFDAGMAAQAASMGALFALVIQDPVKWSVAWAGNKVRAAWDNMKDAKKEAAKAELAQLESSKREEMIKALSDDEELQLLIGAAADARAIGDHKTAKELSTKVTAAFNKAVGAIAKDDPTAAKVASRRFPDSRQIRATDMGHEY